jgi:hypothetical protein
MREISLFSGAGVTGINNNSYQVRHSMHHFKACDAGWPRRHQTCTHCSLVCGAAAVQIAKGTLYNQQAGHGVSERCGFVKADFMNMPFPDGSFDHAYAIDATCHAPDAVACYKVPCAGSTCSWLCLEMLLLAAQALSQVSHTRHLLF